jgi:hypothetical protein
MLLRVIVIIATAAMLLGCVDSQRLRSNLGGPPVELEVQAARKQTLPSRVLGAIALERVTGRKAYPGRLKELK